MSGTLVLSHSIAPPPLSPPSTSLWPRVIGLADGNYIPRFIDYVADQFLLVTEALI